MCPNCENRFTTVEQFQLSVVKRSGAIETFMREKVIQGVRKACKGRPVSDADLIKLGRQVEDKIRSLGQAEVPTTEIGLAILPSLQDLDEVVYLRFASVYHNYTSLDDFETGIAQFRRQRSSD